MQYLHKYLSTVLIILCSCSTIKNNIYRDKIHVIKGFNIKGDSKIDDYVSYENESSNTVLTLEITNIIENCYVLKIGQAYNFPLFLNPLVENYIQYYEYYLDNKNQTFEAYLIDKETNKIKLNNKNIVETIFNYNNGSFNSDCDIKYLVKTKAGIFPCSMHVVSNNDLHVIVFSNSSIPFGIVKTFSLHNNEYSMFQKLSNIEKCNYSKEKSFELSKYSH
jgi:hypothetical protein